ncbi:multidrug ABC transporter ATP-binding protein [Methanomicrobiaceae archaeon CYW5]|uniref:ABC transporter ATP-binding protein n=1 Tax=Methanovulcanius yangii TaxID=1789227 RepID=UPI0029C9D15B|nr:ABC transporter ATP-binding protein [Methanovulcanius yangii]MBT8508202.1 multidrug ABC transporter ATP-binding protein [Methanovulcanius yangii]
MIRAEGLIKDYDGFRALDGVSFETDEPGIFGIIGHNGAGKTTLLKIMAGLMQPTAGTLVINGIDVVRDPVSLRRTLGYLPEESRLYDTMTVDSYLSFFGELYHLDRATIADRGERLLSSLQLDHGGKKIGELSKGMRRKVAIARSLIHDPSLLIYDEPTSGLDPMTSRYIIEYLARLRDEEERTILLSAHNLLQVEEICDRILILRKGREIAFGTMDELRSKFGTFSYHIRFTVPDASVLPEALAVSRDAGEYVTEAADMSALNAATALIAGAGGTVKRIESRYPSLEEMLLKIGK